MPLYYGQATTNNYGVVKIGSEVREKLTADRNYYVRAVVGDATMTIASPAVVTKTTHGLSVDDPIVFSILPYKGTCTMTIASPAVVTRTAHGYAADQPIKFETTGALPTGVTAGTQYYVISAGLATDTFRFSTTVGGAAVNTSGTQSGTHYNYKNGALPTGVTEGTVYYVISAGLTADAFEFSTSIGGAAVNTSGSQSGTFSLATGNDSNTGTAQTRAGAWLTLQKAFDVIAGLDTATYTITVTAAMGNYNAGILLSVPWSGGGRVNLLGDDTYPANVFINTSGNCFRVSTAILIGTFRISGFKLASSAGSALLFDSAGKLFVGKIEFGVCSVAHMYLNAVGVFVLRDTASFITGGAIYHVLVNAPGAYFFSASAMSLLGTLTFTDFANTGNGGLIADTGGYTGGTITARRYSASLNGLINTSGGGASYYPGGTAGATATGGQYV